MEEIFKQSKELLEIIESHRWTLYDSDMHSQKRGIITILELEKIGKAKEIVIGHNYIFYPIPRENETLRDAAYKTRCLGPALEVGDPNDPRWASLIINGWYTNPLRIGLFTRIKLEDSMCDCFSPQNRIIKDFILIPQDYVVDTFQKYFRIVKPEDVGIIINELDPTDAN